MSQPSLADIVSHIHSLPAMPAVALELLQTLSGGDPDVDALASRIARDQGANAGPVARPHASQSAATAAIRARVASSATPSTRRGAQWRWKAVTSTGSARSVR